MERNEFSEQQGIRERDDLNAVRSQSQAPGGVILLVAIRNTWAQRCQSRPQFSFQLLIFSVVDVSLCFDARPYLLFCHIQDSVWVHVQYVNVIPITACSSWSTDLVSLETQHHLSCDLSRVKLFIWLRHYLALWGKCEFDFKTRESVQMEGGWG